MIDFDMTSCRICLEDSAMYPIFESNEEFESVYAKLAVCIREKLEDIEGYPRNICTICKNTSDTICNFMNQFEKTCEFLKGKIVQVKNEHLDDYNADISDVEPDSFTYELQIDHMESNQKAVKKEESEHLSTSISHLNVVRIKLETSSGNQETDCIENEHNVKRKAGRPKKTNSSTEKKRQLTKTSKDATPKVAKRGRPKGGQKARRKRGAKAIRSKPGTEESGAVDRPVGLDNAQNKDERTKKVLLCDHCGATYFKKDSLKYHILKCHTEGKFKCSKCPKQFTSQREFNNHKKRHDNIRPYACDTCEKSFYERKVLNMHIRVVHKNIKAKRTIHKCQFCDRTYTYKRGVVIHERSVHTGERPEVCTICGGSFYDVVYLREHMRIHTGDTPYKCPVCARGYAQTANMKSHMRNHRISELDPDILAKIKPSYLKFMRP